MARPLGFPKGGRIKSIILILSASVVLAAVPCGLLYAQGSPQDLKLDFNVSELRPDQSPVRKEILRLLQLESWFQTLQQYIKVPLPSTGVEEIEVDRGKVSELNFKIGKETGVDLLRFLQFVGKVLVILLEGVARVIRDLLLNFNS